MNQKPKNRPWELKIEGELVGLFHTQKTGIACRTAMIHALRLSYSAEEMPKMTLRKRRTSKNGRSQERTGADR